MNHIPLRFGSIGDTVAWVQQVLGDIGYPIAERTGQFDVSTLRTVIAFQKAHNLPPDGVVEANTWMIIERYAAAKSQNTERLPNAEPPVAASPLALTQNPIVRRPSGWVKV